MGETPCFMMMGREITLPIDLVFGKHTDHEPKSLPDYVEDFINRIEKVHEVVRDRLMNSAERQKRRYDISCTFPSFKTGDGVLLQDNRKFKTRSPKFQMKWCGPFTVTGVLSNVLYQIQEGPRSKSKIIHVNRLKPYHGNMKRWYQPPGEPALNTRGAQKKK
jgi:hypothetical protein